MVKLHGKLKQFQNVNKILSQKDYRNNSILHFSLNLVTPQFQRGPYRHQLHKTPKLSWNHQAISINTCLRMSIFIIFWFSAAGKHLCRSFYRYSYLSPLLRAVCASVMYSITPHCWDAATSGAMQSSLMLINGGTSFLVWFQKLRPENFQDVLLSQKFVCRWALPCASHICMGT